MLFGGRGRIFQGLREAKGTGHMRDALGGYKILKIWRKQKLLKDSKGGKVKAAHWGNLPRNREVRVDQKEKREIDAEI